MGWLIFSIIVTISLFVGLGIESKAVEKKDRWNDTYTAHELHIDTLITYYTEIRKFAEEHADTWSRVYAVLPEEIEKILIRESEVEYDEDYI